MVASDSAQDEGLIDEASPHGVLFVAVLAFLRNRGKT